MEGCDDYDESIVSLFDSACFSFGDQDAIQVHGRDGDDLNSTICYSYIELQEYSKDVAAQLYHRFRPSYVLVDCLGHVAAEAVAILACMRLGIEFVPVSAADMVNNTTGREEANQITPTAMDVRDNFPESTSKSATNAGVETRKEESQSEFQANRLVAIVNELRQHARNRNQKQQQQHKSHEATHSVAAIVCCQDDRDPILGVFAQAQIHQILLVDKAGNLRERLAVREDLPPIVAESKHVHLMDHAETRITATPATQSNDNLYILFTSGTTTTTPKAVVGSHTSTLRRLKWFRDTFPPSPRIGRRTKLTFVDGVTELLGPLLFPQHQQQEQVIVALEPEKLQNEGIGAFLDAGVTQLTLLPSQLAQLLLLPKERLVTLKRVIISGEPCTAALLSMFQDHLPYATLINLYGQTETTGDVLCAVLTDMEEAAVVNGVVAVGKPILPLITITFQNENELVVKGNLCNGYLNSDVPMDSFPTGDVGFCLDHVWYVQGRTNDACKLSGVWTFPTEIESVFAQFYNVTGAVVATIVEDQIYVLTNHPVPTFSRECMRDAGLPWNLIPKQVVVHRGSLPRSASGAAKTDRAAVKEIVQTIVHGTVRSSKDILESLLRDVLRLSQNDEIDMTKSFVELGGDSASAVTFLYQLRRKFDTNLHAVDILRCARLCELKAALVGGLPLPKRHRGLDQESWQPLFEAHDIIQYSDINQAIQFRACVDAPPLIHQPRNMLFAACQGGVVQRMKLLDSKLEAVTACHHFKGWMIQAGLVIVSDDNSDEESLIVCCYNRENKSLVTSLGLDLQSVRWQQHFDDGKITCTPVVNDGHLWVNVGQHVMSVSLKSGTRSTFQSRLPLHTATRPILRNTYLLYASCEYDSGLMVVDMNGGSCTIRFSDVLGPVYKSPTLLSKGSVLITDSYGSIHHANLDDNSIVTQKVSNYYKPLTCACVVEDGVVVVGSYDSMVYGLNPSDWTTLWQLDAQAAIYASPVRINDKVVIICTTAGDIIEVDANTGNQIGKQRIGFASGAIWSDPIKLDDTHVAFGARDSRLHIVTIGKAAHPTQS